MSTSHGERVPSASSRSEVFVVGCGRSGTTLIYDTLASHESFAWMSNWTDRSGLAQLAAFHGVFRRTQRGELAYRRGMPRPSEGYRLWNRALGLRPDIGVLSEQDASNVRMGAARAMADSHRRWGRAPVFLNKNTRNARLLGLYAVLFPEALFIHVLRSPLDAISSLIEVAWWSDLPLWTHGGATPRQIAADREGEVALAAELWCAETTAAREAGARHADRYLEIRYEDFLADTTSMSHDLLARAGLSVTPAFARALDHLTVRQQVDVHRKRLTVREQDLAWQRVSRVAGEFAYARNSGRDEDG